MNKIYALIVFIILVVIFAANDNTQNEDNTI